MGLFGKRERKSAVDWNKEGNELIVMSINILPVLFYPV
jgi:hypothetical protein